MRKEQRTEERVVTDTYTYYIAEDGKEFTGYNAEQKCKTYEDDLKLTKLKLKVDLMKIDEYSSISPFPVYDEWRDYDTNWYRINSEEDYDLLMEYYELKESGAQYISDPTSYPATLCVLEYDDYIEGYWLDYIIKSIKYYCNNLLNMDIEIKEKN